MTIKKYRSKNHNVVVSNGSTGIIIKNCPNVIAKIDKQGLTKDQRLAFEGYTSLYMWMDNKNAKLYQRNVRRNKK